MRRAFLVLAVLGVVGCSGLCPPGETCECARVDTLDVVGDPPLHQDAVLEVVYRYCPRSSITGRLQWVPDSIDPDHPYARGMTYYWGPGCSFDGWVVYDDTVMNSAIDSFLAHELGHWCLDTGDENLARAFAAQVNAEVQHLLWPDEYPAPEPGPFPTVHP